MNGSHVVELFEERASLLDMQGSKSGLDEAIANLAAWMEQASEYLTEDDDWAVLSEIWGVPVSGGCGQVAYLNPPL